MLRIPKMYRAVYNLSISVLTLEYCHECDYELSEYLYPTGMSEVRTLIFIIFSHSDYSDIQNCFTVYRTLIFKYVFMY